MKISELKSHSLIMKREVGWALGLGLAQELLVIGEETFFCSV